MFNLIKFFALRFKFKSYTMIPLKSFLGNMSVCLDFANHKGVYVECGVWKGGMSASIASCLGNGWQFHLFDSFEGLPQAKEIDGKTALEWQSNKSDKKYFDNCSAEDVHVKNAFLKARISNYLVYKGWFKDTLPKADLSTIDILRLDGDWYESTLDCMNYLYPKVKKGGLVIIDDYYAWDGCCKAIHDYLYKNNFNDRIHQNIFGVAYIIKQ